jgi:hypothetical protein
MVVRVKGYTSLGARIWRRGRNETPQNFVPRVYCFLKTACRALVCSLVEQSRAGGSSDRHLRGKITQFARTSSTPPDRKQCCLNRLSDVVWVVRLKKFGERTKLQVITCVLQFANLKGAADTPCAEPVRNGHLGFPERFH